jgi:cyclohexanecarboxylate-CoA ligase
VSRAAPTVLDMVGRWTAERPHAPALVDAADPEPQVWTWAELSAAAGHVAADLIDRGVRPGEPVALRMPNRGPAVLAALGVLRAGALCCPLPPDSGHHEADAVLREAGIRVVLTGVHPMSTAQAPYPPMPAAGQLAFTSGTTGSAKPVLHPADDLTDSARSVADRLGLTAGDPVYVPCPLAHHSGFLYGVWLAWVTGGPQILSGRWDAGHALRVMTAWGVAFAPLATPMLADLVAAVEAGATPPASVRAYVVTGSAVPQRLAERGTAVLGTPVCRAWGSTETCMGTLSGPDEPAYRRERTDGRPLPGVRLRVVGDEGPPLPPGAEGALEMSGPSLFRGYGTAAPFDRARFAPDRFYRTGDLAVLDADGCLRVTGRTADVINRGGEKVPAAHVENLLADHEAIAEVAVAALPDPRLGERACAFVVLRRGHALGLEDLRHHLDERGVTKRYWPERLEIVARLPRNAAGKVRKDVLRSIAGRAQPPAAAIRTD